MGLGLGFRCLDVVLVEPVRSLDAVHEARHVPVGGLVTAGEAARGLRAPMPLWHAALMAACREGREREDMHVADGE